MARPFEFLSRRRFLAAGLGTAGAVIAAGAAGTLWVRGGAPSVAGLRSLADADFRTFQNVVRATFPASGPIPVDAVQLGLAQAFDNYVADLPAAVRRELKLALTLVEVAPLIWDGHGTTFSRMSDEERAKYWATWPLSDRLEQRQVSLGFRKFVNMLFYDSPEVWEHIGYRGPSLQRIAEFVK